jgi:DNA repair protein RadC
MEIAEKELERLTIREWAEDDRPREKLMLKGAHALSDAELLAILIRSGNRNESALDLAKIIMGSVGNDLFRLGRLGVEELSRFHGMGKTKAVSIMAALELGRRRRMAEPAERASITSSASAYEQVRAVLCDLQHEEFWLIMLDRGNRLIEIGCVSRGGMHGTVADPKLIFKLALDKRASSIILAHNHPSGQLRPSEEDIKLTRKLTEGGRLLDIGVHDHVIVAGSGYYSFADNGML